MNIQYDELLACKTVIDEWLGQIISLGPTSEHMLFRKWHLLYIQEICEVKVVRYKYVMREFQWKIKDVESFTLLQCYKSMPCQDNPALRRFMAKLDKMKPDSRLQQLT